MRARPVPFCFQSFRPAPETSPRVLVADEPCRAFAIKFRTAAWIKPSLRGAPKTASDSSTSPTSSFSILRTLTVGIYLSVLLLPWLHNLRRFANHHYAAVRSGHRATNHQQVVFGVDSGDRQSLHSDARVAHVTRRSVSFDDSRRIGRSTDRARRADIHRSMRFRAAIEVVTLDRTRETTTFRTPNHVDHLAVRKLIDKNFVADVCAVARVEQTKLLQDPGGRNAAAGLLEVLAHRLRDVLQLQRSLVNEPELHGVVTVWTSSTFLLHDDTWAGFDHSHWRD